MSNHDPLWWFWWLKHNVGSFSAVLVPTLLVVVLLQVGFYVAYGLPLWVVGVTLILLVSVTLVGVYYVYTRVRDVEQVDAGLSFLEEQRDRHAPGTDERGRWQYVLDDYRDKM